MKNKWNQDICDRLFVEVCNSEKSVQMLEGLVYELRENLSLVFRLSGYDEVTGRDCELVTMEQMQNWGVNVETISRAAFKNTIEKRPPAMVDFQEAMRIAVAENLLEPDVPLPESITPEIQLYVLSNVIGEQGAVYMFDEETMQKAAEKLGGNLIVIPASKQDIFVYPEETGMETDTAREILWKANKVLKMEQDYLSDEVYRYDKEHHTLSLIPEQQMELPDKVSIEEMQEYGYTWVGMLPLTKERALELDECGLIIFRLTTDGTEGMLENRDDILAHDGMFGVEKEEWRHYLERQKTEESENMFPEMS